jgi:hypothetical protein
MISLTRYLYIKDEVKLALLLSILDKKEESIFWAYEIYYSSNKSDEIYDFLWQIYFDFFAIINPSFELYFLTKQNQKEKENKLEDDKLISMIVQDLLIRDFNTDAFLMRLFHKIEHPKLKIYKQIKKMKEQLLDWIQLKDYKTIYHFIINSQDHDEFIYELFLDLLSFKNKSILIKQFQKIKRHLNTKINTKINTKYILLNKVFVLLEQYNNNKDRTFYIQVKPEDIVMYKEEYNDVKLYKVLKFACIFKINDYKFFPLFALERNELNYEQLKYLYHNDWLFYASNSPIWEGRLEIFNVVKDVTNKKIIFPDEDEEEEEFYEQFNYEPDEQSLELKNKTIPEIIKNTDVNWFNFQEVYNKNGIIHWTFKELEDLSNINIYY